MAARKQAIFSSLSKQTSFRRPSIITHGNKSASFSQQIQAPIKTFEEKDEIQHIEYLKNGQSHMESDDTRDDIPHNSPQPSSLPLALHAYRFASRTLAPIINLHLKYRKQTGKEDSVRLPERLGFYSLPRPPPHVPLLWLHAASVGEAVSTLPFLDHISSRLRVSGGPSSSPSSFVTQSSDSYLDEDDNQELENGREDAEPELEYNDIDDEERIEIASTAPFQVLLTVGTVSGVRTITPRAPSHTLVQFASIDTVPAVRRFLKHWKPTAGIIMENELWPNTITECKNHENKGDFPLALLNGRMSDRSYERWKTSAGGSSIASYMLQRFDCVLAQSPSDAYKLQQLGASNAEYAGNLKSTAKPLPYDPTERERLEHHFKARPVWVAASTHDSEEVSIGRVHRMASVYHPDLLTILVPRHPHRAAVILQDLQSQGLHAVLRSQYDPQEAAQLNVDIYIIDRLGELGLYYAMADVAFVGGSLAAGIGGHNLLEPAHQGCAILTGPHIHNFDHVYKDLRTIHLDSVHMVADELSLAAEIIRLFREPETRQRRMKAAFEAVVTLQMGVMHAIETRLSPILDKLLLHK